MNLEFTSILSEDWLEPAQELLFFHPLQGRFLHTINDSISNYGIPCIEVSNGHLHVKFSSGIEAQSLFAGRDHGAHSELVGVVLYSRIKMNELTIIHLAVSPDYTFGGSYHDSMLAMRLLQAVAQVGKQIKGIKMVRLAYTKGNVSSWKHVII